MKWKITGTLAAFSLLAQTAIAETTFERQLDEVMDRWKLTSAIAGEINENGSVTIYTKGKSDQALSRDVTNNTVYAIGSTTKAMVAAGVLKLQEEGKLNLDDPVIDYIPEFRIDNAVSPDITIRDLLTHKVPLPADINQLWIFFYHHPVSKQAEMLANYDLVGRFRHDFMYQNITFDIAGLLIERVTGEPWDSYLTKKLWHPLGMKHTYGRTRDVPDDVVIADAVYQKDGTYRKFPASFLPDEANGAGSALSTANDLATWIQFLVGDGKNSNGEQVLSKASMDEFFTPQFVNNQAPFYHFADVIDNRWSTYALGWFQLDWGQRKIDYHSGSVLGFSGMIGVDRDNDRGMFFFTNIERDKLGREVMLASYFDSLDGEVEYNWIEEVATRYEEKTSPYKEEYTRVKEARDADSTPTLELKQYVGTYSEPAFGDVKIKMQEGELVMAAGPTVMEMSHWQHDQFAVTMDYWETPVIAKFDLSESGKVEQLRLPGLTLTRQSENGS